MVGPRFALSIHYVLGTQADSDSVCSATKECFRPTILQLTEGIFQHYDYRPHSMYTVHDGIPSDSA